MLKKLLFLLLFINIIYANDAFNEAVKAYKSGDKSSAAKLFNQACQENHSISCYNVAVMYKIGDGVVVDIDKSIPLLIQACNDGIYKACYNLGIIYNEGDGVIVNKTESEKYLDIACKNGFDHACFLLGFTYLLGENGVTDKLIAKQYFSKCCAASNRECCKYQRQLTNEGY